MLAIRCQASASPIILKFLLDIFMGVSYNESSRIVGEQSYEKNTV